MGCHWWVSPKPLGQVCWRCLAVPVLFRICVSPGNFALGGDVLHPSYVLFWWAGCAWVVVAWLLWSASGRARWMRGRCGVYMVWVGVFSLSLDVICLSCSLGCTPTFLLVVPV